MTPDVEAALWREVRPLLEELVEARGKASQGNMRGGDFCNGSILVTKGPDKYLIGEVLPSEDARFFALAANLTTRIAVIMEEQATLKERAPR